MNRFEPKERRRFIDTLFDVLGATGAERFADIRDDWRTSVPAMREAVDALDPEQRECVGEVVRALARTATIDKVADAAGQTCSTGSVPRKAIERPGPGARGVNRAANVSIDAECGLRQLAARGEIAHRSE